MEPMTLGSLSGSPTSNHSQYLPPFLMGVMQVPTTRRNKLSPNQGNRNVSFATFPITFSPSHQPQNDQSRFSMDHRSIFNNNVIENYSGIQGPPVEDLFDHIRNEMIYIPKRDAESHLTQVNYRTPVGDLLNANEVVFGGNQNDLSFFSINTSKGSRCMSSPFGNTNSPNVFPSASYMLQCPTTSRHPDFWITVFGFPPSTISTILQYFAHCGKIVDKVLPPRNGNWVHLKYASRLDCDKALSYNEKIVGNIMIGVTERANIDKENFSENSVEPCAERPLEQESYKSAQNESSVVNNATRNKPQKFSGLVDFVTDLIYGW